VGESGDCYASTFGGPTVRLEEAAFASRTRWSNEDAEIMKGRLSLTGGNVYGNELARFVAIDARRGETAWQVNAGNREEYTCAPAAAGDTVYAGRDGVVLAYRLGGTVGFELARVKPARFSYPVDGPPAGLAVADGALFGAVCDVGDDSGRRFLAHDPA
jgi:outer membrane protein assembly factor BamB